MVIMGGVLLSVLAVTLLRGVGMDKADFAKQTNSVKALYAAESAVALGVTELRRELQVDSNPSLAALTAPSLADVAFDRYEVSYVNPNDNYALASIACAYPDDTPCPSGASCSVDNVCRHTQNVVLADGTYAGLTAQQIPIQVLASVDVFGAKATIADIVELNLIPIFQFGLFFDGDMPFDSPPTMNIRGRAHTNGDFVPFRNGTFHHLRFHEPVTAAGYIKHCRIYDSSACLTSTNGVEIIDTSSGSLRTLTMGIEDQADDAAQAAYLVTRFDEGAKDKTRGIEKLNPPISSGGVITAPVEGRPDVCGTLSSSQAPQSSSIELIRRPLAGYTYTSTASNGWDVTYGPRPSTTAPSLGGAGWESCSDAEYSHCQAVPNSVPRLTFSESSDDPGFASERFYWNAHIRIIDGIWYNRDGNVIFDPEDWDLSGLTTADPKFVRGMRYARVTRYSWFWDARESRVYDTSPEYQRGLQMRVTDFDVQAFRDLLKDPVAVSEIFSTGAVPSSGIVVYLSETFDPSLEDPNTTAANASAVTSGTPLASNVRNFLNFHIMDNPGVNTRAQRCVDNAEAPSRGSGLTPCELGFHPYYIWGDGAQTLEGTPRVVSLSTNPTDLDDPELPDPTINMGTCINPLNAADRATLPNYSVTAKAPCIYSGAQPTGPENAVRVVRATHMPEDATNTPVGLTIATDNRMYVYGDVNTVPDGSGNPIQGIAGQVSLIADSITLLSQAFSDVVMQRGTQPDAFYLSHAGQPEAVHFDDHPASSSGLGLGNAPNLCDAWTAAGGRRRSVELNVHASLLMGDVPDCVGGGNDHNEGVSSGGVNNFPRFLEDHAYPIASRRTVKIVGSIVSLFRSAQGNSRFIGTSLASPPSSAWVAGRANSPYDYNGNDESCVYSAPIRDWGFDTALLDPNNLPPGTPRLVQVDRVRWVRR